MDDLIAFLRARLDEDHERANASAGAPWVTLQGVGSSQVLVDPHAIRDAKWKFGTLGHVASVEHQVDADHIARHDPARVLAEVEAKRQLLAGHEPVRGAISWDVNGTPSYGLICEADSTDSEPVPWPCRHARLLASPFAGHPDYREEWRP
jgi:hypothetical protein